MRSEYKRGSLLVNGLMAAVCLALVADCSGPESVAPVDPVAPLEVVATVPSDGAIDVPIEALISVSFSSRPDTAGISGAILKVGDLTGEICCLGRTVTLRPTAPLDYARIYMVEIDPGVTDCNGHRLGGCFVWRFRTVDNPYLPDFPDPPGRLSLDSDAGP